jgi:ribonuclease J
VERWAAEVLGAAAPAGGVVAAAAGAFGVRERRAASAQLARGKYLGIEMKEGDLFLFSSKTIPGNERGVLTIMNGLSEKGVDIQDDAGGKYHVSGHANRPDLEHAHRIFLPDMLLPMHGEHRHLREHMRIAHASGIASIVATNGMMVDISNDEPKVVEYIDAGRSYLDGSVIIGAMDGIVRDRIRMALNGRVIVTVLMDEDDRPLGDAWVELSGLPPRGKTGRAWAEVLESELTDYLEAAGRKLLADDDKLSEVLTKIARQVAMEEIGKKPEVTVVVSRLAAE